MTFEPRMRGRRFRRPSSKKQSARESKQKYESSFFYKEHPSAVPSEVKSRVLNALDHLGSQRFALPPFSEHFERWIKDVRATLTEFEGDLPSVADQPYRDMVAKVISDVQSAIERLSENEKSNSEEMTKLQKELTLCEHERANIENEYRAQTHEARRGHERSLAKLKGEIDSIDKERRKLLRKRPSILERILGRSRSQLEENTTALESKRASIGGKEKTFENELEKLRRDHAIRSKQLDEREEALRTKLEERKRVMPDDALELRKEACQILSRAVSEALIRLPSPEVAPE